MDKKSLSEEPFQGRFVLAKQNIEHEHQAKPEK